MTRRRPLTSFRPWPALDRTPKKDYFEGGEF